MTQLHRRTSRLCDAVAITRIQRQGELHAGVSLQRWRRAQRWLRYRYLPASPCAHGETTASPLCSLVVSCRSHSRAHVVRPHVHVRTAASVDNRSGVSWRVLHAASAQEHDRDTAAAVPEWHCDCSHDTAVTRGTGRGCTPGRVACAYHGGILLLRAVRILHSGAVLVQCKRVPARQRCRRNGLVSCNARSLLAYRRS